MKDSVLDKISNNHVFASVSPSNCKFEQLLMWTIHSCSHSIGLMDYLPFKLAFYCLAWSSHIPPVISGVCNWCDVWSLGLPNTSFWIWPERVPIDAADVSCRLAPCSCFLVNSLAFRTQDIWYPPFSACKKQIPIYISLYLSISLSIFLSFYLSISLSFYISISLKFSEIMQGTQNSLNWQKHTNNSRPPRFYFVAGYVNNLRNRV